MTMSDFEFGSDTATLVIPERCRLCPAMTDLKSESQTAARNYTDALCHARAALAGLAPEVRSLVLKDIRENYPSDPLNGEVDAAKFLAQQEANWRRRADTVLALAGQAVEIVSAQADQLTASCPEGTEIFGVTNRGDEYMIARCRSSSPQPHLESAIISPSQLGQ